MTLLWEEHMSHKHSAHKHKTIQAFQETLTYFTNPAQGQIPPRCLSFMSGSKNVHNAQGKRIFTFLWNRNKRMRTKSTVFSVILRDKEGKASGC